MTSPFAVRSFIICKNDLFIISVCIANPNFTNSPGYTFLLIAFDKVSSTKGVSINDGHIVLTLIPFSLYK